MDYTATILKETDETKLRAELDVLLENKQVVQAKIDLVNKRLVEVRQKEIDDLKAKLGKK
jgi:hypothetical protein